MIILALETSTPACSVALINGDEKDFDCIEHFEIAPRKHTQLILSMIDNVLAEADYKIQDIDTLAFGCGPGAFTGVRVATGVIQAISFGASLPVAQISSLAAVAQGYCRLNNDKQKVLVANDARMEEVYFGAYSAQNGMMSLLGNERVLSPPLLSDYLQEQSFFDDQWVAIGNAWSVYKDATNNILHHCQQGQSPDNDWYPHAQDVAYLAMSEVKKNTLVNAEHVSPVYLRDDVAKKPQNNPTSV